MAPTMIITSSTVTSDDTSKDGTIAMEFTSNESTSNFVVEDITAVSGTLQISKIKIIPADSSGNPSYHGGHWNLGHIDLLDANGNNLITQSSNGISVTATASQSNWGHVENLIAPSINDQKTWGGTSGTMGDHYYVGLTRNTDVTITLPSGTQIAEVILTPWMKYSYWQRTMNVIVELYNDNNVMLSSSFIPAYTNNTPYTGPGSDYGPAAYIFSNDSEISSDINNVLATIPAAISLTDSNGNYRTVVFVPPLSSRFAGSLSNFSGSGTTYNAIFTPSGDATYTINVAANTFTDTTGNSNSASNNFLWTYDTLAPTVSSFTMADTVLKAGETSLVTLTFSEAVTEFSNADITVVNGSLTTMESVNGGITWTGTYTPSVDTTSTTNVLTLATAYTDVAGNVGPSASTDYFAIDTLAPTVSSFTMSDTALKRGDTATVTLVFSEAVTSFSSDADITVQNGSLASMTTLNNITWVGTFTPTINIEDASNILTLETSYTDTTGNAGPVATTANYTIDTTSPTVSSFTMSDTALKAGEVATVTLVFSEAVSGFSSNDDITVQNGSLSIMTTSDNITWTGIFTSTANTQDTENVLTLAASYTDTVGNTGISATTATYIINNICFPKGTPVTTDQGNITIDSLNTDLHTIKGNNIVGITQCQPIQKYIVCIEKDSLSKNVPSQQTLISKEHNIYYQGEMIKAKDLVDLCENVYLVNYNGETLYNVLLKQHDTMMVNNLICETLDPENIVAKISQIKDKSKKDRIVKKLNKIMIKNNILEYQKVYDSL